MAAIGIDFGTSNCCAYVASAGQVTPVALDGDQLTLPSVVFTARQEVAQRQVEQFEFERRLKSARTDQARARSDGGVVLGDAELERVVLEALQREAQGEANRAYWDQSFFSMLEGEQAMIFGRPALRAYFADPLSGVLVKSPKSFLGSDMDDRRLARFEDIITIMLQHIRQKAETASGLTLTRTILGRPVQYHGTRGEEANTQALDVMLRAAARAGFTEAEFELEPLAAAYEYEHSLQAEQVVLVVDVGGGTTDCVMVRLGPQRAEQGDRSCDILGVSGDRVGGTDFDESLAWRALMPAFGKDTLLKSGLPLPQDLLHDAISIRSVPAQTRFANGEYRLEQLIRQSAVPERIGRMLTVHGLQLQHRLVHSAEMAKIALSDQRDVPVSLAFVEDGLALEVPDSLFRAATERHVAKVQDLAREAVNAAGVRPDLVFVTGGMAMSPIITEVIPDIVGATVPIRSGEMLGTVGRGLGLCALRRFAAG